MTYAVIGEDGKLTIRQEPATMDRVREEVTRGKERTPNTVYLDPESYMAGWVNDVSLIRPDLFSRNVVGSCMLVTMMAGQMPYAGPVVITGYDPRSNSGAPLDMDPNQVAQITGLHSAVRSVLDGEPVTAPFLRRPQWASAIATFAAYVRSGR